MTYQHLFGLLIYSGSNSDWLVIKKEVFSTSSANHAKVQAKEAFEQAEYDHPWSPYNSIEIKCFDCSYVEDVVRNERKR